MTQSNTRTAHIVPAATIALSLFAIGLAFNANNSKQVAPPTENDANGDWQCFDKTHRDPNVNGGKETVISSTCYYYNRTRLP